MSTETFVGDLASKVWDSQEWRDHRNAKLAEWIQDRNAVLFCRHVSHFVEIFDDLVDKDVEVSVKDMSHAVFCALYYIPANPFFIAHRDALLPLMLTCTNAWLDANELASGSASEKAVAYTLKGLGVELILSCIAITRGVDYLRTVSSDIRRVFLTHQSFPDYCEETADAL